MFARPSRFFLAPLLVWLAQADPQPPAQGPSSLKNLTLEQLSSIEVTSPSREPTPQFRSPVAIFIITGDDIRRSGVTTIPDALRLAPGVEVARIDSSKWSIGIRGFGTRLSRDVLVLIDGRTVYTPLFAGTYWEVQDTLLEDVDRIEVIRGPGGTIWGPNAVNGVINIITKNSKDTQGTFASAGGGNFEQGFANFRYGGDDGNGLTYRGYFKGFNRGPEHHFDGDNFDGWWGVQAGFRMDWTSGPRDEFTVSGDAYKQQDGERVSFTTYVPPLTENLDGTALLSGADVLFRWKRTISDGNDIQVQAFYDRTNRHEPNLDENRDTVDVDYLQRTKISSRQELIFGAEGRVSDGRFNEIAPGLVFFPFHRADYLVTGFFEDDITLVNDKVLLTAGSKILNTNYTGAGFQPSVRLLWTPNAQNSVWISYTHALRTPSDAEENFYLSSFLGTPRGLEEFARFNANKFFAPEMLNAYELGYRTLIAKNLYVDIASFYNHYHDIFSEDVTGAPFVETLLPFPVPVQPPAHLLLPAQFRNDIHGYTKGVEVAPEWRPTDFWRLRGSYSFLLMNLAQNAGPGAIGLGTASLTGSSPQHEADIDSSFDIGKNIQLDLVYRYVSALSSQKVPAYSTGDARIAWRFSPHLEFSVAGENLFQPFHLEYVADPGLPVAIVRSVYATLAWRSK